MREDSVPILEITDENFESRWPVISNAITEASFIALDCELSGLGNRSKLNFPEIDLRYQNIKEIAQEYSIVSLGISCFKCRSCEPVDLRSQGQNLSVKTHNYLVQTFNILTLCSTKYTVEANSIKFLLSHGFDFNKQYSHGLPYVRGDDEHRNGIPKWPTIKTVFQLLLRHPKPIILHNGFVDIAFLYQSFYADLPRNADTFAADLLQMFPAGIYDTKYISEFHQSFSATFLEYIFKKLQLENEGRRKKWEWHCRITFPPYPHQMEEVKWHQYLQVFNSTSKTEEEDHLPLCESYKFHGWCSKASTCCNSHNIDRIVRELPPPKKGKRKHPPGAAYFSAAQLIIMKKQKMREALKETEEKGKNGNEKKDSHRKGFPNESKREKAVANGNHGRSGGEELGDESNDDQIVDNRVLQETSHITDNADNGHLEQTPKRLSNAALNETDDSRLLSDEYNKTENSSRLPSDKCNTTDNLRLPSAVSDAKENARLPSDTTENSRLPSAVCNTTEDKDCQGHSAGYDAFMTGYIFSCFICTLGHLKNTSSFQNAEEMNLSHLVGKVYLIGKEFPFLIRSSAYGATSPNHDRIIGKIRNAEMSLAAFQK